MCEIKNSKEVKLSDRVRFRCKRCGECCRHVAQTVVIEPIDAYSEDGKSVRFRIGKKVYDTRCENNTRWFNIGVKAFGAVCERIKKMQLKDGSYVSFIGKLDEDTWTDKETGETKTAMVIIVDDIEYTVSGGSNKDSNNQNRQNTNSANGQNMSGAGSQPTLPPAQGMPDNFSGYENFGAGDFFDEGM